MKVINLGENSSVLNSIVAKLRDKEFQKDNTLFRENLRNLGRIFGYELSKSLPSKQISVTTQLGVADINVPDAKIVVATILRAGLPLHDGVMSCFDGAEAAFITAYRQYDENKNILVYTGYCATPELDGKTVILADTMLATGSSLLDGLKVLKAKGGEPACLHLVCPMACAPAVERLKKEFPGDNVTLWVATIDSELNANSYIVPGLGDAGDLSFGPKL